MTERRTQGERRAASERSLLDAAAAVIAERGSSKASFAEIAAAAGCSHGLPHYLFGTKAKMLEALVAELSGRFDDEVLAAVVGDTTGLHALTSALSAFVRSLDDPWPMTRALYVLVGESLGAVPELRPAINDYHRRLRDLIASWIAEGVRQGEIRADVDADAYAALVVGIVRGIGFEALSDPGALDLVALAAETVASVERTLRVDGTATVRSTRARAAR